MWFVYLFQIADALNTANLYKQAAFKRTFGKSVLFTLI